jgi:hypothetical protein
MAVLTDTELREAVLEWCQKRGLPVESVTKEDIMFSTLHVRGNQTTGASSTNYEFIAQIRGFEMKPGGPYR